MNKTETFVIKMPEGNFKFEAHIEESYDMNRIVDFWRKQDEEKVDE